MMDGSIHVLDAKTSNTPLPPHAPFLLSLASLSRSDLNRQRQQRGSQGDGQRPMSRTLLLASEYVFRRLMICRQLAHSHRPTEVIDRTRSSAVLCFDTSAVTDPDLQAAGVPH